LTGLLAKQTGAGAVSGQRSDVVKIFHIDTDHQTISVVSIPRDTLVQLVANQSLYGAYNRINVNLGANGNPSLLVRTIEANFGIPINHVIVVGFGGLVGAVNALGGVKMDFPYPAYDALSDLAIHHSGCQILDGAQALAVARSRHFYYNTQGRPRVPRDFAALTYGQLAAQGWIYDGTSDYGRIDRQNQFLRALIDSAKSKWNPLTINAFLSEIPKGITIDAKFGFSELVNLAVKFHGFNPNDMHAYTLPTNGVVLNGADVLTVDQPAAQQLLVKIFGQVGTPGGLVEPTNPPPNAGGVFTMPPAVATPTTTTTTQPTGVTSSTVSKTTTTTAQTHVSSYYSFNPVAC
jgi:LCP family protein required for cell wall assembly